MRSPLCVGNAFATTSQRFVTLWPDGVAGAVLGIGVVVASLWLVTRYLDDTERAGGPLLPGQAVFIEERDADE